MSECLAGATIALAKELQMELATENDSLISEDEKSIMIFPLKLHEQNVGTLSECTLMKYISR